ncbi:sugar ABC transporter ATP-binding protein [Tellurirhabdus rosea]|uniref:sugar ABC transporter ATP-binding protein n=1 Tax=Tellurirhabdus rosea TaxID=2674997 RepID=UPI00225BE9C3|nr:sugar ABC transporter ATP-binding protein [Tellurirhabdus rosea]
MQPALLTVRRLSKSFPGVRALQDVQLTLRRGEVHGLMGENGAGKSTFMRILMGLETPDSGEILLEGTELRPGNVRENLRRGISMIHQEMLVVPELTVAQNIFLGKEKKGQRGWLKLFTNDRAIQQQAAALLQQLGSPLDPRTPLKDLSVAERQLVEIAKALSNDARILIMDEPTSALSERESARLLALIRELKSRGVAIIYISHKMDEVLSLCDTVTVLRDGRYVATKPTADLDEAGLISLMVGREITDLYPAASAETGEVVLSVRNLGRSGAFSGISFEVRRGEVLGLGGLMGAGRTEVARSLFGLEPYDRGELFWKGGPVAIRKPQDAIRLGIGYVSEDRKGDGFVPGLSISENLTLASLSRHARGLFIQSDREAASATRLMQSLNIRAAGPHQAVGQLSGGNQQKVVIGKTLLTHPDLLILDEPTRGIDIGARAEIYRLIRQLTSGGMAVLLISSDMPELLGLSDRLLVLAKGRPAGFLEKKEATEETVLKYAMNFS